MAKKLQNLQNRYKGSERMKISMRASAIQQSLTRQLFDKAKKYSDVIDFTLGDPDYPTPENIRRAGIEAINKGYTKYSANAGLAQLRQVISDSIRKETGVMYDPEGEIIVTVGGMEALYLALYSLLDPDDEVIILAPYWVNYCQMTQMCGGKPVIIETGEDTGFSVDVEAVERAVTARTRAIILNSPNNPTGTIYGRQMLERICDLAQKHDFMILWDECYKTITYGDEYVSLLSVGDVKDRAVVVNSCSKKFSMTGWRLGYAAAPRELVSHMTRLQENIVACASLPSQYAAIEAFSVGSEDTEKMRRGFEARRDLLISGINQIDKLSCRYPKGTFYAFVNIKQTGLNSVDFAYRLLDSKHVAVVPGVTYGESYNGYIRMAYTMSEEKIREGLRRIKAFVDELDDDKRVLMLGGARQQIPVITCAKDMGLHVITCDYLPDNPGHKYADEYYNISTTDKEAVLELARRLKISGIVAYASDPAAPTAAYVAEKLGLPGNPYQAVEILTRKDLFRAFLAEHRFCTPTAGGYDSYEEALADIGRFRFPVMVKPVDASGSKGVVKVSSPAELEDAVAEALTYSRRGRIIVEEFIVKKGYQVSGDGFSVDGKLVFTSYGNELYSGKGTREYVALGEFWPSLLTAEQKARIDAELQRLITALGMRTSAYNIEVILDEQDNVYILELGPRNGGSYIPQLIKYATGVDTVAYTVKAAIGEDCSDLKMAETKGCFSNYMLLSTVSGKFREIWFEESFKKNNLLEVHCTCTPGDNVFAYQNTSHSLGTILFQAKDIDEMIRLTSHMEEYYRVIVEPGGYFI